MVPYSRCSDSQLFLNKQLSLEITHDSDELFNAHHESKCNLYTFHDPIK